MAVDKLNNAVEETSILEREVMLQFDTMAQLQRDERIEMQKMFTEERADMRKHYSRIILSMALALIIIIGSLVGGIIYIFSNYDLSYSTYQEVSAEGGGDSTVEDGIHLNHPPYEVDN